MALILNGAKASDRIFVKILGEEDSPKGSARN